MNQTQLGLMLKQTWEKARWVSDQGEWRWKDGNVHVALTYVNRDNQGTFETRIVQVRLYLRDVDNANERTDRVPQRFLGSLDGDPLSASAVRSWIVLTILTEQFK
jgi:hypothetical protein